MRETTPLEEYIGGIVLMIGAILGIIFFNSIIWKIVWSIIAIYFLVGNIKETIKMIMIRKMKNIAKNFKITEINETK